MKQHLDSIEKGNPKPGFGRTDLKEDFSNNFDNEPITIEKKLDNCEKRVWDETAEKGYRCAAPVPLNKLRYDAMNNVRYHDSIEDIKSQNPDYDLEFQNITLIDDNFPDSFLIAFL